MGNLIDDINNFNNLKDELSDLPLDPRVKAYIDNSVTPLTDIIYKLSTTALNLSQSSDFLSKTYITKPKRSKIKKSIDTIYDISETCSELYKIIKKRIDLIK